VREDEAAGDGFGALLRRHRLASGLTQEELAERAALSVRAIAAMEAGRTARPRAHSVRLLADALSLRGLDRELLARLGRPGPASADVTSGGAMNGLSAADRTQPPDVTPRQLPAAVPHFAGRADELTAMTGLLETTTKAGGTIIVSAIAGTAGVGKTALAVHWAHQAAYRFPDGQLYVNLRGFDPSGEPVSADEAIRGFLDALGVPAAHIPATTQARAGLYRSLLAGRSVLIVLDNARDAGQVRPLLPGSPACLVVVTSRSQLAGLIAADGARPLLLDVLTPADAHELLTRRLGAERLAAEPRAAEELIELCARLPLALAVVAARAATSAGLTLDELASDLRVTVRRLDALDTGDAATSPRAVFSWSYQMLSAPAARMFRLLGLHPGPDITVVAAASLAAVPLDQSRALLRELARCHLVTEQIPGRHAFHDMLRAYAAEQAAVIDSDSERRDAIHQVLDHYLHTARAADRLLYPVRRYPTTFAVPMPGVTLVDLASYRQALAWLDAEHRVLLAAVSLAADNGFDTHAWQLPWMLETFFYRRSHWHDWSATQHTALEAAHRLGDQYAQTQAHRGIASAQIELGRTGDALTHLARALRLRAGGPELQARLHIDISRALDHQESHREALPHSRRALRLSRTAGDPAKATQADALNMVGWLLAAVGDYQQALGFCQQALTLHRQIGDKHSEPATLDSLAYAHSHLGHHAEAAACYRRAVELFADLGDHHRKAETLTYAGDAHHASGDVPAARDAWAHALAILEDLHHPEARQVRAKLALLNAADDSTSVDEFRRQM
jgi:tetratricopeptide (TPR) repeat protein/transcriptional regulator with XRE-family HTH domain